MPVADLDYAYDGLTPVRWLVTEIVKGAENPPSLSGLADRYRHLPTTGDVSRVILHEKQPNARAANAWIIRRAFAELDGQVEERPDGTLALKCSVEELAYRGDRLSLIPDEPPSPWPGGRDLWNPNSGIFAGNIRTTAKDNMDELRESMRAYGWVKQFPAIRDERGVVLVGHRRLTVAKELGIEPVFLDPPLHFGRGDAADAERVKVALVSNIGIKALTPGDRKRIGEVLYGEGWTMERIAQALDVSKMTISRDLASSNVVLQDDRVAKDGTQRGLKPKRAPKLPGTVVHRLAANVKPDEWEKLKGNAKDRNTSAANVLGEAISRLATDGPLPTPSAAEHVHRPVCGDCGQPLPERSST